MLARYETEYRTMAGEKQEWDTKLSVLDAERASMEAAAADREEAYRAAASEAMTKQREMDRIDGDYRVQESSRRHGAEEMDRLRRLAASHGEAAAEAETALAAASEEKEACRASLTEARKALADAETAWAAAQHRLDEASASHRQKLEEIREKTGKRSGSLKRFVMPQRRQSGWHGRSIRRKQPYPRQPVRGRRRSRL